MAVRRLTLWLLLAALALAPLLGQVHRLVHGTGVAQPVGHAHAQAHGESAHGVAALFGLHDDVECRLYDQLAQADGLPGVPPVALPLALAPALLRFFQDQAVARWAALFDARGPPRLR